MDKKTLGQYFTTTNPFKHESFNRWLDIIPDELNIIEPFAGSNNIIRMLPHLKFTSYDIEPQDEDVIEMNTIESFPTGFNVCITNPPYLSSNSAKRRSIDTTSWNGFDDLYKLSLSTCLNHCDYVAVIIPESFITSNFPKQRLIGVVSLTMNMFDDTNHPVCLAMFGKNDVDDFDIYQNDTYLGTYNTLSQYFTNKITTQTTMKFNVPNGLIGVQGIDSRKSNTIRFVKGDTIPSENIKHSSRSITRLMVEGINSTNLDKFIDDCNLIITNYRATTHDVLLTSFKGLRSDGKYRRRLDFKTIRLIINMVLDK